MDTIRLTTSGAVVRYLAAQRIDVGGDAVPLFAGVFAIFGHGNVTCLGHELEQAQDALPTWRGQNEQGMALAACGFARASKRRRIMVAASSIGPGATNMVTAAAVAMANRLPLLVLSGDTFEHRIVDPVLQQVEHFGAPATTVNDAFRAVVRYWDRITTPEQVMQSLPHAVNTMLDPGDCGPAFVALPQDVQAQAYDYPVRFFDETLHRIRRPRPDAGELRRAAAALASADRPLIIAGGGVRWSLAEEHLAAFAEAHGIPVVETTAGRTSLPAHHPLNCGPIGVTGCTSANAMAAQADVVLAVGTRMQDFTTGSWTVFGDEAARIVGLNAARFDATKHMCLPLVADAREGLIELGAALGDYRAGADWTARAAAETAQYHAYIDKIAAPATAGGDGGDGSSDPYADLPTYAQVVGAVDRAADDSTYVVAAAGGLPGELVNGWRAGTVHSFDCEYGYSCMGYEISGAWGAKMAMPEREVMVLLGDGSYLMMNSDLYSTVITGHKLIVIVCDNGGYAVIDRLQVNQGGASFNNLFADCRTERLVDIDFAAHAASMGCETETVATVAELEAAIERARAADRTYVIALRTHPHSWTGGGSFWEVGVPEVSSSPSVMAAREAMDEGRSAQRVGW
ncbi:MAG: 3D-(3,5/4)-trihydroxycyclohexane-1,2-dione acylhydrolase (decyclizing) [Acidimicrobiaceae bacterium]|nr:3D-(3,5/4)-trihydroxycyclohexane-1,2-dione acylhydrolase (decyclizing) [Acidimicrobiaceae bacterium]